MARNAAQTASDAADDVMNSVPAEFQEPELGSDDLGPPSDGDDPDTDDRTGFYEGGDGEDGDGEDGDGEDGLQEDSEDGVEERTLPLKTRASSKRSKRAKASKWSNVRKAFPVPITRHFRDDNANPKHKPQGFLDYWKKVYANETYRDRTTVYIYRNWPVCKEGKRQVAKAYAPIEDFDALLKTYGCGDYHLKINDMGNRSTTAAVCTVKNVGDRDLTQFPPVLDLEAIDLNDPLNTSYIQWCRTRGIRLPGEEDYQGGNEMANIEVTRELTGTVGRLTERILDQTEEERRNLVAERERIKREREEQAKSKPMDPGAESVIRGLEVIQKASETAANIVDKGVERAMQLTEKAKSTNSGGSDMSAIEMIKAVKDILPPPQQSDLKEILSMMAQRDQSYIDKIFLMQNDRIAMLEKLLEKSSVNSAAVAADAQLHKPATLKEQLGELKGMKDDLRDILGIGGEEDEPKKSWTDYIPQILQGITILGTVIAGAMHNMAVARTGQGVPAAVPPPEHILTPDQMAGVQAGAAGVAPGSYAAQYPQQYAQPMEQPQQPQPEGDNNAMERFKKFLQMIQVPMLKSYNDGESGAEFAAKLIDLADNGLFGPGVAGRQIYDAVLEYGESIIGTLIKTYPPIWQIVSQTPTKWTQFLHEFCTADQIWEAEEMEDQRARDIVQNPTATADAQADGKPVASKGRPR